METDRYREATLKSIGSLSLYFRLTIIFGILSAMFHVLSIIDDGFSITRAGDTIFNFVFGILGYLNYRFLERRDIRVIGVTIIALAMILGYGYLLGRGFNVIIMGVYGLVLYALNNLRRRDMLHTPSPDLGSGTMEE